MPARVSDVLPENMSFHVDPVKRAELDAVAEALGLDRDRVLNGALDAYLELHRWQVDHIQEGLRQAQAGEFASDDEVTAAFDRWIP
jgi:predicted transcriptional regulator